VPNLRKKLPHYKIEKSYQNMMIVGIDEAGRGPLAGPVVAACVMLDEEFLRHKICKKINDSKLIEKRQRKEIFAILQEKTKFGIGVIDEKTIDRVNILQATKLAMFGAYRDFCAKNQLFPQIILVDGNMTPFAKQDQISEITPIIKGDSISLSIAAASIIAKETRDKIMGDLHQEFPHFSWDKNSAYATKLHLQKIKEFGICKYHRRSFEPIKSMI